MSRISMIVITAAAVLALPFFGCSGQNGQPASQTADQSAPPSDAAPPPSEQAAAPVPPPAPQVQQAPPRASTTHPHTSSGTHTSAIPEERQERPAAPPEPQTVTLTIPAGTQLALAIPADISSATAQPGDAISATLKSPITVGSRVAFPEGSQVKGSVSDVKSAKKGFKDTGGAISIQFTSIVAPDGNRAAISAGFTRAAEHSAAKKGGIIGGSAVGGALLGRALGKSAAGGAALGAAIGTGVAAGTKGREAVIKADEGLQVALDKSASVTLPR